MRSSRAAGYSKWGNLLLENKDHVERARKVSSSRLMNKKRLELLLADPEDSEATPTVSTIATPTPDSAFFDSHSDEVDSVSQDSDAISQRKCRTCFEILSLDTNVKDLYDKKNSGLRYDLESLTGVWIQRGVKSLPHHICKTCQDDLKKSIEFRDKCIQIDKKLNQTTETGSMYGLQHCDDEIESELENVLYEQSAQQTNEASGVNLKLDFLSDSECALDDLDFPLEEEFVNEDIDLPLKEVDLEEKKSSRKPKHACNEIVSIKKCETKEEIGKVAPGDQVYKVVLSECNRNEETTSSEPKKKQHKLSLPVPKYKPRLSDEEKRKRRRERVQAQPFKHVCEQCGHSFRQVCHLQMHLLRHNSSKNFDCPECPKKFYDSYSRNIHLKVRHKGENPFPCNHCSESFASGSTRHKHEREVHGAGPRILARQSVKKHVGRHFCTKCTKSYKSKKALSYHMNSHDGTKPFECKVCGRGFTDPSALKRHQALHDKFPFYCEFCLKGFLLRCKLNEHQKIHTGERPYCCEICDAYYRYRYNLNKHYKTKTHHNNVLKAQENECNGLEKTLHDFLNY
ncbi:zinc finger protein 679 [Drosophila elegans]|uniref:zinc finger protein 679 n=1 Tax=Drosophila elegans TaxID=30023 RepID=UPI0007E7AE18|nr:zinc finger protein 679 [Drosophila elegans]